MPIPDSVVPKDKESEHVDKNRASQQRTIEAANALIASSLACPNIETRTDQSCYACGRCKEVYEAWYSIGG